MRPPSPCTASAVTASGYLKNLLVVFVFMSLLQQSYSLRSEKMRCERIKIPLCQKIGYNRTYMPNMFAHKTQTDAALIVHQFWPLVAINCSPDLKFFLCSTYAPICEPDYGKELLPCRSLCQRVQSGCVPLMKAHGFSWPENLDCRRFPRAEDTLCMDQNLTKRKPSRSGSATSNDMTDEGASPDSGSVPFDRRVPENVRTVQPHRVSASRPRYPKQNLRPKENGNFKTQIIPAKTRTWKGSTCGCTCEFPFVYVNQTISDGPSSLPACALPCQQYFFDKHQQEFTTFWLTLWAVLCLVATVFTCATALIDLRRFQYPERPIIFIAFCYMMMSLGFVIRLAYGFDGIACNSETGLLRYSATGPARCTAVFLLIYFFGMASWIWWVILALNWFLTAGMKWSKEAIANYSQYFHFVAWLMPTIKSMAVLAMAAVDSDPVSGICYVGNHNNTMLTIFVIAPLLIYLVLGSSFLLAGLLALFHIRRLMRQGGSNTQKLEKLMVRIGVFSVLYIVPATVVIVSYFYEYNNRENWERSVNCPCFGRRLRPKHYVFLVKYFMTLVVGLASGFWVWGAKTLKSWKHFLSHITNRNHPQKEKFNGTPVAV